jgi:hypothetical protein
MKKLKSRFFSQNNAAGKIWGYFFWDFLRKFTQFKVNLRKFIQNYMGNFTYKFT